MVLSYTFLIPFVSLFSFTWAQEPPELCPADNNAPWTYNSLHQSPCAVASYLGGACTGALLPISPLDGSQVYSGPTPDNANACRCSTVYYSMISACALCQSRPAIPWSLYSTNCTTTVYDTIFPAPLPQGVAVPHYAYLDVTTGNVFNPRNAEAAAIPSLESSALPIATSSSTSPPGSGSGSSSKAGPIAGGVVAGLVGILLIAGIVYWLLRRRRQRQTAPHLPDSSQYSTPPPVPHMTSSSGGYTSSPSSKYYDPSDPSTFPRTSAAFGNYTPMGDLQHLIHPNYSGGFTPLTANPTTANNNNPQNYTGVPEV